MSISDNFYNSIILAYHHVCNHLYPTITRVTKGQFEKQIKYLKNNQYSIKSLSNLVSNEIDKNPVPNISITFDDAFSCMAENALPILVENNIKATIFVITNFVGKNSHWDYYNSYKKCRHLSWNQLRDISKLGFELGSHSHSHFDLKSLKNDDIKREMAYSKKYLEDKIGKKTRFFSYPFGRYNKQIMRICEETGYIGAVSMNPVFKQKNCYALPRSAVYLFDSLSQFRLKLKLNPVSVFEKNKLKFMNCFSMGTIILKNFYKQ